MNICMLHGYLLEGSGSNIYVQNLVRAYCRQGHHVFLFCQERHLKKYDFVSSYHLFDPTNTKIIKTVFRKKSPYKGKCHVYNPNIGALLPVYVKDRYEHFKKVKTFPTLTHRELTSYIEKNVTALKTLLKHQTIDSVHTNHEIMTPYIALQALKNTPIPYVISCHGSALNYSVKGHPHLKKYAVAALKTATFIFSPSAYLSDLLRNEFSKSMKGEMEKIKIIPNGVDLRNFRPVYHIHKNHIHRLKRQLKKKLKNQRLQKNPYLKMDRDILKKIDQISWGEDRILLYIGKFMKTKGPRIILKAMPSLLKTFPNLKLLLVGYGPYRKKLEEGATHLKLKNHIFFTGLLEHPELKFLLPLADILIVPSLFPETFGMTAAEGMASGVPTLVTYQSGLKDFHHRIETMLKSCEKRVSLKKMRVNEKMIPHLISNIETLFHKNMTRNALFKQTLHLYAKKHFSWDKIAIQILDVLKGNR